MTARRYLDQRLRLHLLRAVNAIEAQRSLLKASVALGVVSHVPGGVGVFEASVTALLSGAGRADLLAALLLYRAIYNLLPFCLSLAMLAMLAVLGGSAHAGEANGAAVPARRPGDDHDGASRCQSQTADAAWRTRCRKPAAG